MSCAVLVRVPVRVRLGIGIALWIFAVAMTPHEVAAAQNKRPIDARTLVTLGAYLSAAILVLCGVSWQPRGAVGPSGVDAAARTVERRAGRG